MKPSVLILEDEPFIAMDLNLAFEDADIVAHTATTTRAALELYRKKPIAAAVLDVNLGGGETCLAMAQELKRNSVPFVLHTGDLDRAGELIRNIDAPIIAKPANVRLVVEQVLALLDTDQD